MTIEDGNKNSEKAIQVTWKKMVEMYAGSQYVCKGEPKMIQKS